MQYKHSPKEAIVLRCYCCYATLRLMTSCDTTLQRSVDQADADMYRDLHQKTQSLHKQLVETKQVGLQLVLLSCVVSFIILYCVIILSTIIIMMIIK